MLAGGPVTVTWQPRAGKCCTCESVMHTFTARIATHQSGTESGMFKWGVQSSEQALVSHIQHVFRLEPCRDPLCSWYDCVYMHLRWFDDTHLQLKRIGLSR